jgi:hypothetical protein
MIDCGLMRLCALQDFLICIEMFFAAIAHYYSFSHLPYADDAAVRGNCCATFWSMWDVRDMRDDMIDHARYIGKNFITYKMF